MNWEESNKYLGLTISELVREVRAEAETESDIASQEMMIVSKIAKKTDIKFLGIEPFLQEQSELRHDV